MKPKVIVIGAGVNGVGTAFSLLQRNTMIDLTIISDQFSPNTTSKNLKNL